MGNFVTFSAIDYLRISRAISGNYLLDKFIKFDNLVSRCPIDAPIGISGPQDAGMRKRKTMTMTLKDAMEVAHA